MVYNLIHVSLALDDAGQYAVCNDVWNTVEHTVHQVTGDSVRACLDGLPSFRLHNHVINGLDSDDNYMLREMIVDPINYRFRDKPWTINNQDANQNSLDPSTNNCSVSPVQL